MDSIVQGVQGTMEEKSAALKKRGVDEEYRKVHAAYAENANNDLESLKRGLLFSGTP